MKVYVQRSLPGWWGAFIAFEDERGFKFIGMRHTAWGARRLATRALRRYEA